MQYGQNPVVNAMIENVPTLTGSERQIAWGDQERSRLMYRVALAACNAQRELATEGYEAGTPPCEFRQRTIAAFTRIHDETRASWWIEQRGYPTGDALILAVTRGRVR